MYTITLVSSCQDHFIVRLYDIIFYRIISVNQLMTIGTLETYSIIQ